MMSSIFNEQLTEGPRESYERAITMNINKKSDSDQNLMLGVNLSIKTNSLTGRNISLVTVFDLSTPLNIVNHNSCASLHQSIHLFICIFYLIKLSKVLLYVQSLVNVKNDLNLIQ